MIAELVRYYTPLGTWGKYTIGELALVSIEKVWLNNTISLSCIPEGEYECRPTWSSKNQPLFDWAYEITNVPNRTDVKIHIANFPKELEGCVGLGTDFYFGENEVGVRNSRNAIAALHSLLKKEPFILRISQYQPHAKVYT